MEFKLKLVIISDTHNQHEGMKLPDGDLLIHCGDCTGRGDLKAILNFNKWLGTVKDQFKHGVIMTPGNHDFGFQNTPEIVIPMMTNAKVLINEAIEIDGLKFYGSPITPTFCNWAFMKDRGEEIAQVWEGITPCDVLITHGPPKNILDRCPNGNVGCEALAKRVFEVKPKLHCFGHIHSGYGYHSEEGIKFINAAILDNDYKRKHSPITIEVKNASKA